MYWMVFLYALLGLALGSFLNVCIHRLPRGESIVLPRSRCPQCGSAIAAYDNIPLLSFLLLRGRCRSCGIRISLQYPLVELFTGLACYACAREWSFTPPTFVNSLLLAIIIALIFIDYHHQILPNRLTLPGTALGIGLCRFQAAEFYGDALSFRLAAALAPGDPAAMLPWMGSIAGALIGGGILLLVAFLYQIARRRQGLGMGDVKMMAMVGAFLGWRLAMLIIFIGSALGSIIGILLIMFRGQNLQTKLAFGTFLGAAAAIALFYGLDFIHWYAASTSSVP